MMMPIDEFRRFCTIQGRMNTIGVTRRITAQPHADPVWQNAWPN